VPLSIRATMRGMAETDGIATALGQLTDDDLARLRAAADSPPDIVPGLLAYLDHAGDWEQHRRREVDFELQGPMAALEDDQTEAALAALRVLSARFRASGQDDASALFDAIAETMRPSARPLPGEPLH
jgi:hypothetical protein